MNNVPRLSCADVEVMLADYIDQTLLDRDVADLKAHFATCASCRELAADAKAAVNLMERAAVVEAPPELVNRILFDVTNGASRKVVKPRARSLLGRLAQSIWQPRFAMGMAMTMLSFGMLLTDGRRSAMVGLESGERVFSCRRPRNPMGRSWREELSELEIGIRDPIPVSGMGSRAG